MPCPSPPICVVAITMITMMISLVFPKPEQKEHESGDAEGASDSAVVASKVD